MAKAALLGKLKKPSQTTRLTQLHVRLRQRGLQLWVKAIGNHARLSTEHGGVATPQLQTLSPIFELVGLIKR